MNQNLSEEKKDIKPERPDLSSNRRARKTGGGGFLFSSLVLILNSIGLIILFIWFFYTSGNQQKAGLNIVERINEMERNRKQTDTLGPFVPINSLPPAAESPKSNLKPEEERNRYVHEESLGHRANAHTGDEMLHFALIDNKPDKGTLLDKSNAVVNKEQTSEKSVREWFGL